MLNEWLIILLLKAGAFGVAWKLYRLRSREQASDDDDCGEK
jgi:hypothetical protein